MSANDPLRHGSIQPLQRPPGLLKASLKLRGEVYPSNERKREQEDHPDPRHSCFRWCIWFDMLNRITLAACTLLFGIAPVTAQETPSNPAPPLMLTTLLRAGSTWSSVSEGLKEAFERLDVDGNGKIDAEDSVLLDQVDAISRRGFFYVEIMGADLNGDGAVTESELRLLNSYIWRQNRMPESERERAWERHRQTFLRADADKDGKVTMEEALVWARTALSQMPKRSRPPYARIDQVLAYADPKTGSVNFADLQEMVQRYFQNIDKDGDGVISREEHLVVERDRSQLSRSTRKP